MKKIIIVSALIMAGCAAKPLIPDAAKIKLSDVKPSEVYCKFAGEVVGGQGNWWTDDITSTKNIVQGSRNDLRNQAYALGANYVHIQQSAMPVDYVGGKTMAIVGNAYQCVPIIKSTNTNMKL